MNGVILKAVTKILTLLLVFFKALCSFSIDHCKGLNKPHLTVQLG